MLRQRRRLPFVCLGGDGRELRWEVSVLQHERRVWFCVLGFGDLAWGWGLGLVIWAAPAVLRKVVGFSELRNLDVE